MSKYLIRRILLVIPTMWLVLSLLFVALSLIPGDAAARKAANLEGQGAATRTYEIIGEVDVENTTHRVLSGETLDDIAAKWEVSVSHLLANDPDVDASGPLRAGLRVIVIPGERLGTLAISNDLARSDEPEAGIDLLRERNPGVEFPEFQGEPYAEAGTVLKIRDSVTLEELAHVKRVTAQDWLNSNEPGSPSNPDGTLTPTTPLYPGDPIVAPQSEIGLATYRNRLGLDRPLGERYLDVIWDTVRFKFDPSLYTNEPSLDIFLRAAPKTLHLNVYALIVAVIVSIPVGVLAAIRQDRALDYVLRGFSILALAAPSFWTAIMLIVIVTPGGISDGGLWTIPLTDESARSIFSSVPGFFQLYTIPAVAGGIAAGAGLMRITRSEMLEVVRQDYVRTAWAKGLRERVVVQRHVMRNAMVNVLSVFGLALAGLVSGNVILEVVFNVPGLGFLLFQRIQQNDVPVVYTIGFFFALLIVLVNIIVDLGYALVDPRIRYS